LLNAGVYARMTDSAIIDLFYERSEKAITEAKQKYYSLCRHIAKNILLYDEDVDECINDAFLAVWNAIPPERPDKLSAFVCKITKNIALNKYDYITSQKRNPNMAVSMTELEDCLYFYNDTATIVENREIITHINTFLRKISFDDRNIFLRKYFFGDSLIQISTTFKFSESKVKSSLHRTKNKLKSYLEKKGVEI
jgi:RNA polymerase sigma-70 factor (ECF subfamily)